MRSVTHRVRVVADGLAAGLFVCDAGGRPLWCLYRCHLRLP